MMFWYSEYNEVQRDLENVLTRQEIVINEIPPGA